jgi:hypothetical protein
VAWRGKDADGPAGATPASRGSARIVVDSTPARAKREERESLGEFGRGEGELGLAFIGEEGKGRGLWGRRRDARRPSIVIMAVDSPIMERGSR